MIKKKSNTEDLNLTDAESGEINSQENGIGESKKVKKSLSADVIVLIIFVALGFFVILFNNPVSTYIKDFVTCESYGASIWVDCHNLKVFGSDYCKVHICALEGCKNESYRAFDYPYCEEHNCMYGFVPIYDTDDCYNFADGGGAYCSEHTCCDEDCDNAVFAKDDGYECSCCSAHMCMYKYDTNKNLMEGFYCYSYKDGGGYYCSAHTCIKKDCTDEVYSGRYCRKHYFDNNR